MFDRIKERKKAREELAASIKADHPEFAAELEGKYGMGLEAIIAIFLPLIMKWLEAWLDKKNAPKK